LTSVDLPAPARPWWVGLAIILIGIVWVVGAFSLPQTAQYAAIVVASRVDKPLGGSIQPGDVTNCMLSGWLIFLAMAFDALDGHLARLARVSSDFGAQLDSLCDLVTFGVAPAFLAYHAQIGPSSLIVGAISLMFVFCGAWRLALFNVAESGRDFRGMPITVAGGILTAIAYMAYVAGDWPWPILALCTVGLSGLMICRVRFIKLSRVLVPTIRRQEIAYKKKERKAEDTIK